MKFLLAQTPKTDHTLNMDNEMSAVAEDLVLEAETEAVQHSMRAQRWPHMRDVWESASERAAGDAGFYGRTRD
jgi:hypothetical protein